jgi:hypothetical protein
MKLRQERRRPFRQRANPLSWIGFPPRFRQMCTAPRSDSSRLERQLWRRRSTRFRDLLAALTGSSWLSRHRHDGSGGSSAWTGVALFLADLLARFLAASVDGICRGRFPRGLRSISAPTSPTQRDGNPTNRRPSDTEGQPGSDSASRFF